MSNPLDYPVRRRGMDHDRYAWSMLAERAPVTWPGGAKLAVWVNVNLQFFPLNPSGQPVKVPGNMTMPYPDLRHYSLRDYGNRVGLYRVLRALDAENIAPTVAFNARLAERTPALVQLVRDRSLEVIGHSWSMNTPHASGMDDEAGVISRSLDTLRRLTGQPVLGWLGPGKLQSADTPDLLAQHGIAYMCDWVNDELPYRFETANGPLWSLPLSTELEDRFVLMDNLHSAQSWAEQLMDAADLLHGEAQGQGGRLLALNLHPWVIGQPHRIKYLEQAMAHIMALPGVWAATSGEIVDAFASQQ